MSETTTKAQSTVGVIIPAFNEEENLSKVLQSVTQTRWLTQIIVVDDGSSDNTLAVAERYALRDPRVLPLRSPENQGKAAAMYFGVRALTTDYVIFLDADLIDLQPNHLWLLYHPVEMGFYDMTLALFRHGRLLTDASHKLTPNLSGQRCLRRSAAEAMLMPLTERRFGVEVGLTVFAKIQKWKIKKVYWTGVSHVMKEQKRHGLAGINYRRAMYGQILSTWMFIWKKRATFFPSSIEHQPVLTFSRRMLGQ